MNEGKKARRSIWSALYLGFFFAMFVLCSAHVFDAVYRNDDQLLVPSFIFLFLTGYSIVMMIWNILDPRD